MQQFDGFSGFGKSTNSHLVKSGGVIGLAKAVRSARLVALYRPPRPMRTSLLVGGFCVSSVALHETLGTYGWFSLLVLVTCCGFGKKGLKDKVDITVRLKVGEKWEAVVQIGCYMADKKYLLVIYIGFILVEGTEKYHFIGSDSLTKQY